MKIINFIILNFLLTLSTNSAYSQVNNWEYKFEKDVNKKIIKTFVNNGIINSNETVIAYYRLKTDNYTGSLALEMATILTDQKVIDYQRVGESVIQKTILLDNILKLELNDQMTSIYVSINEGVTHNAKFDEDRLSKNGASLSSVMKDKTKGHQFYKLIDKQWRTSKTFEINQQIYGEFFDQNGDYILRSSDQFRLKKMDELKSFLDNSVLNTFRSSAYIYCFHGKLIYEIDYDKDQEKYLIIRLEVSDSQKDGKNNTELFLNYKYVIKDKYELPYNARGIEYIEEKELVTENIEDLVSFINEK